MIQNAFTNNPDARFTDTLVAFVHFARANGLNIGIQETLDTLNAASFGMLNSKASLKYGLKAICCCTQEETVLFERLFDHFWSLHFDPARKGKRKIVNKGQVKRNHKSSLVMLGEGKKGKEEEESQNVSGANAMEKLRRTDFSKVNEIDSQLLDDLAQRLYKEMAKRLKRKMKIARLKGTIDLRKTIRANISHGGEPVELFYRFKKPHRQKLVVLLDVSGSMDKYSFFLLRFVLTLKDYFKQVEAFIFSTHLIRITDSLKQKGLAATLQQLSYQANNWSSGTKIGNCLAAFNEQYAKRYLNGHSLTIVLSDGLDTGTPEVLAAEMNKIKRRSKRLFWLNPLKGMDGYAPTATGMSAALPYVDSFRSAHNLESLLELENLLANV